ncbi:MAG: hypothetical protein Unbinned657contig1001_12 [Prokaryotic dsDNA virus sp.]|jgi:hypothetical protein|nr:MAG: hypothetical protein Unbinned657contig1001_12 [Prokaryotic dsDNA virus sp.]|tara:strand:- start:94 stop:345 length:252 start_codon:yes stop_codon:yes gene_type:complete
MKFIKARKQYECQECKGVINKNDQYHRKSVRVGSPKYVQGRSYDRMLEINNGNIQEAVYSYNMTIKLCAYCAIITTGITNEKL